MKDKMDKKYEENNMLEVEEGMLEIIDRETGEVLYFPDFYSYYLEKENLK